ncbi:MAG TPA: response regulator [Tepidisphaeraceae bacterium]|jgi:CheY-like chemotaxis protein|nr:response regulator [Tepidisphaeraceae bacterium]
METPEPRKAGYIDALRLSPRQHTEILNELDARHSAADDAERRIDQRLRFTEQAQLFVQLRHPGGTAGNYLVRTRNLSRTGIGFLHGTFVYNGTPCTIALRSTDKIVVAMEGRVVRCNHVRGHVHEVGVRFDKPIRLRQFLGGMAPVDGDDAHSTELPRLSGRVLSVDDSTNDQDLLKFHLHNLGVDCDVATTALDAVDMVDSAKYDFIISNTTLGGGMSGFEFAEALRKSNFTRPIVAMTADESDLTRTQALARGFTAVLIKPYRFEDLLHLLLQHFTPVSSGSQEVLASELWSDVPLRPLIRKFLERLTAQVGELHRLAESPESQTLFRKLCTDLKGSAGSYGYPGISRAAHALLDQASPYEFRAQLATLESLCSAAVRMLDAEADAHKNANANNGNVAGAA